MILLIYFIAFDNQNLNQLYVENCFVFFINENNKILIFWNIIETISKALIIFYISQFNKILRYHSFSI